MAMQKIPTIEQSLLCSSIYINNFKRVIEELVYNSLDAAASSIAIRVSVQENFIQVLDNGNGILKDNFSLLGQKYATSKYVDINTLKSAPDKYGYRGLCIASIIDVSRNVQITSQYGKSNDTWMKIFYNGKEKEIRKTFSRPSKGTTVEIRGFLYNLNIQRKSIDPHNELLNIKIAIQQLSLVHCNVSISLRDDYKNDIILQIHKNRTIYDTLQSVFQIKEKYFQELQVEKNKYKIKAFVGKHTVESNNDYQYIFINGKYIHKSVLHRKLNESLSNFLNTRNNRRKDKHMYDVKNNYCNWNVPFYFAFITCPNYDFDMTYNSENTLIEFKDWNKVNNLIGKLVQFYSDGFLSKKKERNKIGNEEKKSNTRTEVKKIMETFLNNKNKLTRISQLQNGIKGKILKRNHKKKKDLSVQKVQKNKKTEKYEKCQLKEFPNSPSEKPLKNQLKQQHIKLMTPIDSQMMPKTLTNKVPNLHVQKIRKPVKTLQKNFDYKDSLIRRFKAPTNSVRKRCKYLNRQVLKFLDKHVFKKYSGVKTALYSFINNETRYQTTNTNTGTLSLCKMANNNFKEGNKIKINNLYDLSVKKSCDLIKAVITSQYNLIETEKTHITHCRQSYKKKTNYTYNETFPMETYNSHNLNMAAVKKMGFFLSKTSRNNIFLHEQKLHPISIKSNSKQNKSPAHRSSKNVPKSNILGKYGHGLQEYSHYTIEITDSHEMVNCRSGTLQTVDYNILPQDDNRNKSLHFGNTYTFKDFMRTSHNNDINKTDTLQTFSTSIINACYNFEEIEPSINIEIYDSESNTGKIQKDNFTIPESDSDYADMVHNNVEPINYCEAVLNSPNNELQHFGNEFENSFFHRWDDVTLNNYNIDGILNKNEFLKVSKNNFKSNQDLISYSINRIINQDNCQEISDEADTELKHKKIRHERQSLKIDTKKIYSDSNYNFQLRSRLRCMPKGMSPIANNQSELQNAYTFNNDEECYKDMMYKNFANNVLLNTEIFEPEVQNVKNLFSKHIEKVNSEIQYQNGDLIFDSLSLMQAKILGQVDRKFIASILNGRSTKTSKYSKFLVLFDQHAVDERVRLESNLSDYIQDSDWKSIDIDPVSIVLSKDDYVYFVNHRDKLARFGLQWTFTSKYEILLNAIPNAILGKNPRQVEIVIKAVKNLISEQIMGIRSLKGNVSLYPKSIMDLVFSEACRYAIKFGDKLSKSECATMINSLAFCKTPFQCAHGRPAIAVLMELRNNSRSYKVNLTKVRKFRKRS